MVYVVEYKLEYVIYWQYNGCYIKFVDIIEKDGEYFIVYVGKYFYGNYYD